MPRPRVSRERLLNLLEQSWKALRDSYEGMPDRALLEPGVVGHWSVRDVLSHITTWEEEFLKVLPLILEGKPLPRYGSINSFNAREQERKQNLSLEQVTQQLAAIHEHLTSVLTSLPETSDVVERRLRRRLRLDSYRHYGEHAAQIAAWRESRLSSR